VLLLVGLNLGALAGTFGSFALGSCAFFVLATVGIGRLLGGSDPSLRSVFALGAGNRNISAALIVAGASFDDPAIQVMLIVASVVGLLVLLALARLMR
jgi:BASS family bile acid:Na+ symporter